MYTTYDIFKSRVASRQKELTLSFVSSSVVTVQQMPERVPTPFDNPIKILA